MKKSTFCFAVMLTCLLLFAGCASQGPDSSAGDIPDKREAIPFSEGQGYALAYLGYQQMEDLDFYVEKYLDSSKVPIHYLSSGDYYLVIPRYSGMALSLYQNDLETSYSSLIFEDPDCGPFILQCNASDIFADATIRLTYESESFEFSPFISLEDGSIVAGPGGVNITKDAE